MQQQRNNAYKLIAIQGLIVIVASLFFLLASFKMAYSVLLGGACCILPSIYFAHKLFRYLGAQMARKAIRAFYVGEVVKLVMIGVFSVLVFLFVHITPMGFFLGFILAQLAFWIAPNFILRHQPVVGGVS